jgi:putrescine transport system ATP-binding protein
MKDGRLQQIATPRQLYEAPASRWVAEFVGDINIVEGEVTFRDSHRLTIAGRDVGTLFAVEPREPVGDAICVAIRPEKIRLSRRGPAADLVNTGAMNSLDGIVSEIGYRGGRSVYKVKLDHGAVLQVALANTARLDVDAYSVGEHVAAWFTPDDCVVLAR